MSYINTWIQAPERPARRKGSKIKWTYSQWARWAMSRSRPNSPIRPPTTYVWEDLRRSRSRGGYPWTHLDKEQLPDSINPEVILHGDEALYRSLSSSPVPFDYPVHQHNRSLSFSSSDNNPELQAISYTSSNAQPNGSLTGSLNSDYYNMAERHRLEEEEEREENAEGIREVVQQPDLEADVQQANVENQPAETDPNMTVQEQVQAFIDDLPSDEELPEYVVAYLSQRTDDDSLPEHILEYLQQRVTKLQNEEQALRELSDKQQKERAAKKEESCSDELPDFVKAYLSNRQDDDSLPDHILEYLKEEADRIQVHEEELGTMEQTFKSLEKNQLSSYDDHYVLREQPEEVDADPFDQLFVPSQPSQSQAPDDSEPIEEAAEAEEVDREAMEESPEKKKKRIDIKEAMRSISVPAREGFNSLKRNVQKVNADAMKKLRTPSFRRAESTSPSPIRRRIEKGFNRVQERMSSLTRGKKRSKSRMEQDIEDGYEPIAHPSAVPFQITTYESEDQVPRVYGRSQSTSEQPQGDGIEPEKVEDEAEVNLDNVEVQKDEPGKTKVSVMFSRGKDVWKNTTAKSKDALKSTAAKSKDAIIVTANKSKDAINRSKVALQSTAAKSKEALRTTGEKLQTTMKLTKQKKVEEPKVPFEPQDSLEGTSSAIFDIESPVLEAHPAYDVPPLRGAGMTCDTPSFSCDVASSTPKTKHHVRAMVLESSQASEDFFPQSEETVEDQLNLAVDNPDYYNINFTEQIGPATEDKNKYSEDQLIEAPSTEFQSPSQEEDMEGVAAEDKHADDVATYEPTAEIVKLDRDTIEKPIRKSKLPKAEPQKPKEPVTEPTAAEKSPEEVLYENFGAVYENTELQNSSTPEQTVNQEEPVTLSRRKRKTKKASPEPYDVPTNVYKQPQETCGEPEEDKENKSTDIEQRTLRPARTKKLRSISRDAEVKEINKVVDSVETNIDLNHYAVPKSFDVDIEAFNEELKAAFTSPVESYRISPNRPSRSRTKKKTISSAVHDHHYHNIPLTKRKSFSRDLPNVLNAEIIIQEQAPSTLPRKKSQPKKPARNRSKALQSSSLAECITTIPRRKKRSCKPALHDQNTNVIELKDDNDENIKTFPRRKSKRKDGLVKIGNECEIAKEIVNEKEALISETEKSPLLQEAYMSEIEKEIVQVDNSVANETEAKVLESLSVPPQVLCIQDIHESLAPTTLPRKKKGSRLSSAQREEQALEQEAEGLATVEAVEAPTEGIVEQSSQFTLEPSTEQPAVSEEIQIETASLEAAVKEELSEPVAFEESIPTATVASAVPEYITSGDSQGGESSDAAERIQWVEITSPTGGTDDSYGYAVITKVGSDKKKRPPRPPPPAPEEQSEQYEYPVSPPPRPPLPDTYCTAPRRKRQTPPDPEPSFCTMRPPRPRRKSAKEKRQSTPHPGDSDHIEELQSAEVVERMNKRPLPPLPRSKKKQSKAASDSGSDRDSSSDLPISTEEEQTKRLKLGQLPTIISTDGSQDEPEIVQEGRLSFCLSENRAPVLEDVRTDSPSKLLRSVEMEDLTVPDAPITPAVGLTSSRLSFPALSEPFDEPVQVTEQIEQLQASPIEAQVGYELQTTPIVTDNDVSSIIETRKEEIVEIQNICIDQVIPSSSLEPAPETTEEKDAFAIEQTASEVRPTRSPVPVALTVDPEKERHLNDLMNEVEKNLEVDVEKDLEDKIILLSSSSTQNLTYTPIEEVSISVQTDPSQEFEPLTDIIRPVTQDASSATSEPSRQQMNVREDEKTTIPNLQTIIQPVVLNPQIQFPRSIPVEVPVIPPVEVQFPQRMRLSELEVDRLTVSHLTARTVSMEQLTSTSLLVNEIQTRDPLNVTVTVDPSTIQLRAPEIPPQQVVHVYERSESPAPVRPRRRKTSSYAQQEECEEEQEKVEEPLSQPVGVSQPPPSFATLRPPDEPNVPAEPPREPTVRELASQLAVVSARELGSMAANAVGTVSHASQLILRNIIEGMWTQVNAYLERHGILLDSKEQETSKVIMICLLILVLIVIFFGLGGSRGPRWEFYLPPN